MNTATMRRIDRVLGRPMCAALTLVRLVSSPFARAPRPPRRILVVKLAEQGAWVVAAAAIRRATDLVGSDNVFLMTFDENRFVIDQLGLVPADNVISVRTSGPVRTAMDLLAALRFARARQVDTALDFEFFARSSAILCFLSGATTRVGFHASAGEASYRGDLMTHRLSFNPRLHVAETFRSIVDALDAPPDRLPALDVLPAGAEPPPMAVIGDAERARVEALIRTVTARPDVPPLVLLNANAGDLLPLRRWPTERYVELARRLIDHDERVVVLLTGSPAEAEACEAVAAEVGSDRCVSMGGRTSLRELIVLYSLAEVMVTNDSGPAHYAALAPVDVVTLFGPESPHIFGSLSPRNHSVWAGLACSPCVNAFNDRRTSCTDNVCMQRITVDEVFGIVTGILERRVGASPT